jgi:L-ornithine N5-oxygenase
MQKVDILLVGAGPSNIALAVAIEEARGSLGAVTTVMLETAATISWHPGMLFPQAQSQVSFLKDLITLKDPTSRFTFLNFLKKTGRLEDFVNLQTFFPYRREISEYLRWCVGHLEITEVHLSSAVTEIIPSLNDTREVKNWAVTCQNGKEYIARRIIYGAGRRANIPELFGGLGGVKVLHASRYLQEIDRFKTNQIKSIAIIGGAQSSAEIYQECIQRFPKAQIRLLMRSIGMKPYGGSKFTNELYSSSHVNAFHAAPEQVRSKLLAAMHDSNYAGVTPTTLEALFRFHYLQRLDNQTYAQIHTQCDILDVQNTGERISIRWSTALNSKTLEEEFDLIVLGTGYENELPQLLRKTVHALNIDSLNVDKNYRADIHCARGTSMHVLGVNEATHGISDTLLSVVGTRAEVVLGDIEAEESLGRTAMRPTLSKPASDTQMAV